MLFLIAGCAPATIAPGARHHDDTAAPPPAACECDDVEPAPHLTALVHEQPCATLDAEPLYFEPADVVSWQLEVCWTPEQEIPDYVPTYGRRGSRCAAPVGGWSFARAVDDEIGHLVIPECTQPTSEPPDAAWGTDRIVRLTTIVWE
jgi:hypothetical protein